MKGIILAILFSAPAFAETAKVVVNGMVCAFCAQGIKKTFAKEPAVENVEVDMEKKIVTVKLRKGQNLDDEKIQAIIRDSGYATVRIERTAQ